MLADGRAVFAKVAAGGLGGVFDAEARGLRWLGEAGAAGVPEVLGWDEATLIVSWVPPGRRTPRRRSGSAASWRGCTGLARPGSVHPGPGSSRVFLCRTITPWQAADHASADPWPGWYRDFRVLPYLRLAVDAGTLTSTDARLVESAMARAAGLAGPGEPPSRIHGDLWSGNVVWSGGSGWLVDPAAHGGHRETDLAMLALFGAPYLDRILGAYAGEAPLAPGWRQRIPLHQLHPLLVHVCLFGTAYREETLAAARSVLAL